MNERQRKISWAVYFAIFLAVLRELIHDNDAHDKFRWLPVVSEVAIVLGIGWICYYFARNRRN
jgi:hypothetical protein